MKRKACRWRAPKQRGVENATELRYVRCVLTPLRAAGEILSWRYEPLRLRIGAGAWYTPDYWVAYADGVMELVDVKGSGPWEEAARVRIKVAADCYPEFRFVGAQEAKGRRGVFGREVF